MKILNAVLLIVFVLSLVLYVRAYLSNKFLNPSEPKMFEQWKMEMGATLVIMGSTGLFFIVLNFVF